MMKNYLRTKFNTVYRKLMLCSIFGLIVLVIVIQLFYTFYNTEINQSNEDKVKIQTQEIVLSIENTISTLNSIELHSIIDKDILFRLSDENVPLMSKVYDVYFELSEERKFFQQDSNINSVYFYFSDYQYLLPIYSHIKPSDPNYLSEYMDNYIPNITSNIHLHEDEVYLINTYRQSQRTYHTDYRYGLIVGLNFEELLTSADYILWMADLENDILYSPETELSDDFNLLHIGEQILDNKVKFNINNDGFIGSSTYMPFFDVSVFGLKETSTSDMSFIMSSLYIGAICLTVLMGIIYSRLSRKLIHEPLNSLSNGFKLLENGDYKVNLDINVSKEFIEISDSFNHMTKTLNQLFEEEYKSRLLGQEAKFQVLQSKINPHFLYNCFFQMESLLLLKKYDTLNSMLTNLGDYFQYIFKTSDSLVAFDDEINHARIYAYIQQIRFDNRIHINIDKVPPEWEHVKIPCLIIQPLVENAFQHGFGKTVNECYLNIMFIPDKSDNSLTVIVENNGASISSDRLLELQNAINSEESSPSALQNTHQRLLMFYGSESGLQLSNLKESGFKVEMKLYQ